MQTGLDLSNKPDITVAMVCNAFGVPVKWLTQEDVAKHLDMQWEEFKRMNPPWIIDASPR